MNRNKVIGNNSDSTNDINIRTDNDELQKLMFLFKMDIISFK